MVTWFYAARNDYVQAKRRREIKTDYIVPRGWLRMSLLKKLLFFSCGGGSRGVSKRPETIIHHSRFVWVQSLLPIAVTRVCHATCIWMPFWIIEFTDDVICVVRGLVGCYKGTFLSGGLSENAFNRTDS